jgi:hypothetical protein
MRYKYLLRFSGVTYNFLESLNYNVVVGFEGNGHLQENNYRCGAAATE